MMVLLTAFAAFFISLVLSPLLIGLLRRFHFGQQIREDGPRRHRQKAGTPTMGGVIFLLAVLPVTLLLAPRTTELYLALMLTAGSGLIGFADDFLKVAHKRSLGLKARSKLLVQSLLTAVFFLVWRGLGESTELAVPFTAIQVDAGLLYLPFLLFFVLGFTNAVNLTDGIDGLAAGTAILALLSYLLIAMAQGAVELVQFSAALLGATFAFLIFNLHPARVFMGDVGSFSLGAALAALAVLTKTELFLVIIGGVFVLETISVIAQVLFFRSTGKRIFRMSPLHHHFELSGLSEWQVVTGFWALGFFFAVIGLLQLGVL